MLLPQSACAGVGLSMELKAATPPARAKARRARATRAWSRYFFMAMAPWRHGDQQPEPLQSACAGVGFSMEPNATTPPAMARASRATANNLRMKNLPKLFGCIAHLRRAKTP